MKTLRALKREEVRECSCYINSVTVNFKLFNLDDLVPFIHYRYANIQLICDCDLVTHERQDLLTDSADLSLFDERFTADTYSCAKKEIGEHDLVREAIV